MASFCLGGFEFGNVERCAILENNGIELRGLAHPLIDRRWLRGRQLGVARKRFGFNVVQSHQLIQSHALDAQIVVSRNFLRQHQVITRLGFAAVGDGGRTYFKVALGSGQLLGNRHFLCSHKLQTFTRNEHVKVSLA